MMMLQVSSTDYDALISQMTELKLQVNKTSATVASQSATMVNLQQQVSSYKAYILRIAVCLVDKTITNPHLNASAYCAMVC